MNDSGEKEVRQRLDALFEELLELAEGEEREARLRAVRAEEPELEASLRRLLRHAEDPPASPLDGGLAGLWERPGDPRDLGESAGPAPQMVGPWRLVREVGRGGMGTVYLGHRDDGEFHQEAAIKLVRAGVEDREILRRFELERQILAELRHPNIAQLLDGGRTAEGHPYFAMEYVRGRAIDRYCDEGRLTVPERLELFCQVAKAVEHAHRRLVIHRDLKPSNIVVTDEGQVKLLDFGIAKLLGSRPRDAQPMTATVLRVLTPEYASPEQIRGEVITTSSDVYQLGLLLYELLTGQRVQRLRSRTMGELERSVLEDEPTRPSQWVTSVRADPSAAWSRRTQPEALARKLDGDLDNLVMLALRKEPERRYASVSQLRDDIERHLQGLPISARAPTLGYRLGKFLRRHALAATAAAVFVLLLVGYAVTATIQGREIRRERDRAEVEAARAKRVTGFLASTFEAADPYRNRGDELTARELLEAGAAAARTELAGEPEVLSEMLVVLGSVSSSLGSYERAEELLTEGLDLARELHPGDHAEVARAEIELSQVLSERGNSQRAVELAREALGTYRRLHREAHPQIADGLAALAAAELFDGNLEGAEELFREEVALRESLGLRDASLATALNNLGSTMLRAGRAEEAAEQHRRALALRRFLFPPEHPDVAESLNNLAVALRRQHRLDEAEPLYREALEIRRRVFGDRHVRVANTLNNLGELLRRQGRLAEAEAILGEALEIRREVLGEEHANVAFSLQSLGLVALDRNQRSLARERLTAALAMMRRTLPGNHHAIAYPAVALGRLEVAEGHPERAAPLLEEALAIRVNALGEDEMLTAEARVALGICRAAEGRRDEAVDALERGLATLDSAADEAEGDLVAEARGVLVLLRTAGYLG